MENPNVSASQNIRQEENKTNLKELVPLAIVTSGIIGSVYGLLCYINPIIYISFLLIFGIRILLNVLLIAINDGSKGFEKILLIAIAVFICLFG